MSHHQHLPVRRTSGAQAGFMLLEVLISILIFAFGVLAIVGLQASAAKDTAAGKYRSDAMMLVNDLIGRMWAGNRAAAALTTQFKTDGSGVDYNAWLTDAKTKLPGIDTTRTKLNMVVVVSPRGDQSVQVAATLAWKAPNEAAEEGVHSITVNTQITP